MKRIAVYDPDNEHSVPLHVGDLRPRLQRRARSRSAMPDAPVDSLADDFRSRRWSRKFQDCGVSVLDEPVEVVQHGAGLSRQGSQRAIAEDLQAAEKVLMAIRPYLRYIHSSRYIDDLANGEICLALGWSGDIKQARDRARESRQGHRDRLHDSEGRHRSSTSTCWRCPPDAPHPQNAHLVHQLPAASRRSCRGRIRPVKYANVNPARRAVWRTRCATIRTSIRRRTCWPSWCRTCRDSQEYNRLLTRMWTRFKTGK